jgi:hypothetical protein
MKLIQSYVMAAAAIALLAGTAQGGHPELPLDLGAAGNYVILAKSGISTVPPSVIVGHMGVSPITATAITGFGLVLDGSGTFSTSPQVDGRIYAADYANPTPANLTTEVGDMETAYTAAAGRTGPDATELHSGNLSGKTLAPGLYKWSTGVLINDNVTLAGGANDVWIFQIAGDLTVASAKKVLLSGGAQARNIFWQVGGGAGAVIGTTAHFEGIILTAKKIVLQTGATFNGRLLAQTAVTLDQNVVKDPETLIPPVILALTIRSAHGTGTPPVGMYNSLYGAKLTNRMTRVQTAGGVQYVCTGWTLTGNQPRSGLTATMAMTHTNNAVLTWQWKTNYLLNASAGPGGTVTGSSNRFYAAGSRVSVTALPRLGYRFAGWTGHVSGPTNVAVQSMTMNRARTVVANFAELACGALVSQGAVMELDLSTTFPGTGWAYAATSSVPGVVRAAITSGGQLRLEARTRGETAIIVGASHPSRTTEYHIFPMSVLGRPRVLSKFFPRHEPWNPRFEQRIVVKNDSGCDAIGLRLLFSRIRPGIVLENQTGRAPAPDRRKMIEWEGFLPNGATQRLRVVYLSSGRYRPDRAPPTVEIQYILPDTDPGLDGLGTVRSTRVKSLRDGRKLLEFSSRRNRLYAIEYMDNAPAGQWTVVPLILRAGANRTQWIDYGPPATHLPSGRRAYRARDLAP